MSMEQNLNRIDGLQHNINSNPVSADRYGEQSRIPAELIDELRGGNAAAFEKLYTHMGGPLEDFLAVILHSREDARELTQEVFADVWEHRESFSSGKNFKGYIYVKAKNLAFDQLKRRKVEMKYLALTTPNADTLDYPADELIAARETEILIRMTLATMPEKKRRVFEMRRFEGKSEDEIALELDITKQTVQVYLSTVQKELAELLLFMILFLYI